MQKWAIDQDAYLTIIYEINNRADIFERITNRKLHMGFDVPTIEVLALQVRMCLELVSLASLAANKKLFEQQRKRFHKHWHPKDIIRELAEMNPNFYPCPLIEEHCFEGDKIVNTNLIDRPNDYLTRDELIAAHGFCGNFLHAQNPFGKRKLFRDYEEKLRRTMTKLLNLIDVHKIQLFNDHERFFLVQRRTRPKMYPNMYEFVIVENEKQNI
jgi:hypothetical protein